MVYKTLAIAICLILLLHFSASQGNASSFSPLTAPPLGDRWFSISMNGEKVGFSHTNFSKTPEGFRITSEGSAKILVMGFSREAAAREIYEVSNDLTLRSFQVEQTIDKSSMNLSGTVTAGNIKVTVKTKGGSSVKALKAKGGVYPPPVINLLPLMKGIMPGKTYAISMIDVEAVKLKEIEIEVIGIEKRNDLELFHLRNNLYPLVDNDIWVDSSGNTLEESVRDGLVVTKAENPENAARSLLNDAVAKKDLVLDFSLVKTDRELPDSAGLKKLVLELSGYPDSYPLPEGPGQKAFREKGSRIKLVMTAPLRQSDGTALSSSEKIRYLSATPRINSDHQEILSTLQSVLPSEVSGDKAAEQLSSWVSGYLEDTVTDSHTAYEAFKIRAGNCQSHARLYVSMARAAGIPTRMVSGLVYLKGKGFLYHSWAESHLDGWVAIDPTFGQFPADITHIKLVEGDEPEDMAPLAAIIGKVRARIIETAR